MITYEEQWAKYEAALKSQARNRCDIPEEPQYNQIFLSDVLDKVSLMNPFAPTEQFCELLPDRWSKAKKHVSTYSIMASRALWRLYVIFTIRKKCLLKLQ